MGEPQSLGLRAPILIKSAIGGSLRVAAAVIGGLGALVGAAKGVLSAGGWLFVGNDG